MFFNRKRVEEDLDKIRNANLKDKDDVAKDNRSSHDFNNDEDAIKLEKGDLLAMTLAIMSIIVPYILAFVGIMLGVVFLMMYLY
jgi:hypothetical protein